MATLKSVLATIEHNIGFPVSRTRQVARRLQEADIIPTGGPRRSPELDIDHFVSIVAASAMEDGLADVVSLHRCLHAMKPGGLPSTPDVPAHLTRSVWEQLQILAELALGSLDEQRQVVETQIEFVSSPVAEIIFRERDGVAAAFYLPGHRRGAWAAGHRRSTTIRGGALVSAVRALFK